MTEGRDTEKKMFEKFSAFLKKIYYVGWILFLLCLITIIVLSVLIGTGVISKKKYKILKYLTNTEVTVNPDEKFIQCEGTKTTTITTTEKPLKILDKKEFDNDIINLPEDINNDSLKNILHTAQNNMIDISSSSDDDTKEESKKLMVDLSSFINKVFYIQQQQNNSTTENIKQMLEMLGLSKVERRRISPKDTITYNIQDPLMNHLISYSLVNNFHQHQYILFIEDDIQFYNIDETFLQKLEKIDEYFEKRWDVIVLHNEIQLDDSNKLPNWEMFPDIDGILRINHYKNFNKAYIINSEYLKKISQVWWKSIQSAKKKEDGGGGSNQTFPLHLQNEDIWLTFSKSVFKTKNQDSKISFSPILSTFDRKKIGICLITNSLEKTEYIRQECSRKLFKGHSLQFIIFLQQQTTTTGKHIETENIDGHICHIISVDASYYQNVINNHRSTLYRYHYIAQISEFLKQQEYDFLFYFDLKLQFHQNANVEQKILNMGKSADHLIIGAKTTKSYPNQIFIETDTSFHAYFDTTNIEDFFAIQFQGGKTNSFLEACQIINDWIEKDLSRQKVTTKEKSYWNRYIYETDQETLIVDHTFVNKKKF